MIISLDWLRTLVDFNISPRHLADLLTAGGLETEVGSESILKLDLTPNRPDCMSHLGVAREVAVLNGGKFNRPVINLQESDQNVEESISVEIKDPVACPRYAVRIVRNVKIGPSPDWMSTRLETVGIRSINNVVDIANYVLMELGHPLHTFDLSKIEGEKIIVRLASEGEKIITLDHEERILNSRHLLICDTEKPIALAGIMGCANSEVTESTQDILIESAYFDPVTIRRGAKFFGLNTEASKRFERGTDYEGLIIALNRTAALLAELAGGSVDKGIVDAYPDKLYSSKIDLRTNKIAAVIGQNIDERFIEETFNGLEIATEHSPDGFICIPPSFRPDLDREIDLIEELARVFGYETIPSKFSYEGDLTEVRQDPQKQVYKLKSFLAGIGFNEILSNSLMNRHKATLFVKSEPLEVQNPLSHEMSALRPSLIPGLLRTLRYNLNRNETNLALFEYGVVFSANPKMELGREESAQLAGIVCGKREPQGWRSGHQSFDFYYLKGIINALAKYMNVNKVTHSAVDNPYYFDNEFEAKVKEDTLAVYGSIQQNHLKIYEIEEPVFGFSINLEIALDLLSRTIRFSPVPQFPGIVRDFSFSIGKNVKAADVEVLLWSEGTDLLKNVELIDLYTGEQIGSDEKSVSFRLQFQATDRTLTDEEIDDISTLIIQVVRKNLGAKLR